jgi:hypothetical protein
MITTMWRKHWMELRGRWFWMTALATLPCIFSVLEAVRRRGVYWAAPEELFGWVAVILIAFLPARLAGAGVTTAIGTRPQKTADPSLLFTLSLPLRRRTFLLYRASFGLLALEAGAVLALLINALVFTAFVSPVAPWRAFTYALWIMVVMLPLYFLDTLLSIRFTEIAVVQIQAFCIAGIVVALNLAGLRIFVLAFHHLTVLAALPGALGACLISAGFIAATVWSLDRQDF